MHYRDPSKRNEGHVLGLDTLFGSLDLSFDMICTEMRSFKIKLGATENVLYDHDQYQYNVLRHRKIEVRTTCWLGVADNVRLEHGTTATSTRFQLLWFKVKNQTILV